MRALQTFVVAALMATTAWTSTHAAERADLLLVLAADVSGSMDESKFELQRSGATPVVHSASLDGPAAVRQRRAKRSRLCACCSLRRTREVRIVLIVQ